MPQGAHGAPKKPAGAKEHWEMSKGQKQCGIFVLVMLAIIGISVIISPKGEDEAPKPKGAPAAGVQPASAGPSVVTALNDDSFDAYIEQHPDGVLVDFQSDSCSFCAKLAPVFESAAKEIKAKNGPPFAVVSADTGAELMKKYEISRFPSVYWFWQGHNVIELPRAAEKNVTQIVDWVDWVQLPALQELANSEYSENIELLRSSLHSTQVIVVGFASAGGDDVKTVLEAAAQRFKATTVFLYITDANAEKGPFLKTLAPEAANDKEYTGKLEADEFVAWVKEIVDRNKIAELEAQKDKLEAQKKALEDEKHAEAVEL